MFTTDRVITALRSLYRQVPDELRSPIDRLRHQPIHEPRTFPSTAPEFQQLAVDTNGDVHSALEAPEELPQDGTVSIRGWVAAPSPIREGWCVTKVGDAKLDIEPRPDLRVSYGPFDHIVGFAGRVPRATLNGPYVQCRFEVGDRTLVRLFGFSWSQVTDELRTERVSRIADLLCCPLCRCPLRRPSPPDTALGCDNCRSSYQCTGGRLNFLNDALRAESGISDTESVSAHEYDPITQTLLGRHHAGLVLDCGAGMRPRYFPNVVNYEIVPYKSTDVIGVNEYLPFADNTFDAVLSLSVLEHVRDPFKSAREILRVLKVGGDLYCNVPLLAPVHGYPHHYYNMTSEGLKNLFGSALDLERVEVPGGGLPIFALTWILRSWADGLPPDVRAQFLNFRVADLIGEPTSYWKERFVADLTTEKQFELAATTMIVGTKR